jgi:hypothetical protein
MFVEDDAAAFLADHVESKLQLSPAIAPEAVEYVSCEALRVNPNERRGTVDIAHSQDDRFLYACGGVTFIPVDPEMPESGGEVGFCDFEELESLAGRDH